MTVPPDQLLAPVLIELGQAMFYCYDQNIRVPVGIVHSFAGDNNHIIRFPVSSLPAILQTGNSFAAELFFYRKAFPFCIMVKGRAEISNGAPFYIRFTVEQPTVYEFAANSYRQVSRDLRKKTYKAAS